MTRADILPARGRILQGYRPFLSIEITKECPLRCPGCYAYEPGHLGNGVRLRKLSDLRGQALVNGVLGLVRRFRPMHLTIVGGEPLVRYMGSLWALGQEETKKMTVARPPTVAGCKRRDGLASEMLPCASAVLPLLSNEHMHGPSSG